MTPSPRARRSFMTAKLGDMVEGFIERGQLSLRAMQDHASMIQYLAAAPVALPLPPVVSPFFADGVADSPFSIMVSMPCFLAYDSAFIAQAGYALMEPS